MAKKPEDQETRYCLECGKRILSGGNGRQLFCSDRCKMRYWRKHGAATKQEENRR